MDKKTENKIQKLYDEFEKVGVKGKEYIRLGKESQKEGDFSTARLYAKKASDLGIKRRELVFKINELNSMS